MIASRLISQDVENLGRYWRKRSDTYKAWDRLFRLVGSEPDVPSKGKLDSSIMYELIQGHCWTVLFLFYAAPILERVVEDWIIEEEWGKAIDVITAR